MKKQKYDNTPKLSDLEKALRQDARIGDLNMSGDILSFTKAHVSYQAMTTTKRVAVFQGSKLVHITTTVPAMIKQLLPDAEESQVNGPEFTAIFLDELFAE